MKNEQTKPVKVYGTPRPTTRPVITSRSRTPPPTTPRIPIRNSASGVWPTMGGCPRTNGKPSKACDL